MANEMIERVARIVFDRHSGKRAQNGDGWETMAYDHEREIYRETARAAIEAMMEPTPDMIKRGSTAWCRWNNDDGPYDPEIPDIWQAMLSAALEQPRPVDEKA